MSYSYGVSGEQSSSGRAKRWLLAYPLAQLVCLAAAAAATALAGVIPWIDPSHETFASTVVVAIAFGLTFGYLRGCVLREKFARFSMLTWCAAITLITLYFTPPVPESLANAFEAAKNLPAAARAAIPVILSGFVYGIVIGAAEALSLRRAAFGLLGWTIMSGFAWGIGHIAASAVAGYAEPLQLTPFEAATVTIACTTLQAAIAGLVMLPALRLLTPRLSYYGPRVYRTALRTRGQVIPEA